MANEDDSSSAVTQALQNARYNEIVQLTIQEKVASEENTATTTRDRVVSLVACLDPEHGGIQWNPLSSSGDGDEEAANEDALLLARHLQTKRWISHA
jgi:hypothetical protein